MAQGLLVKFFLDSVELKHESRKQGRPIFEDREFISIIPIGDNKTEHREAVTDQHRQRFAAEYAAFKRNEQDMIRGTPLTQWPVMRPGVIAQLRVYNVESVEQLAALDDIAIQRVGPGTRDLVNQAKAYLAKAAETAAEQFYAVENDRLKDERDQMLRQMEQMRQQVDQLMARDGGSAPAPRRGRPPKVRADETQNADEQAA
jgi:hypothetical protein